MTPQNIRVGVIGSGSISDYHIQGVIETGAEVVGIFSRSDDQARRQAQRYGIPFATTRYQDLLERDDITAVIIATPDFTHEEIAVAAARAGKAILLQKPMARNSSECLRIIAAAHECRVPLFVSFMHRYFPEIQATQELLRRNVLGKITMVRQRNATPGADWADWFYHKELVGGGALMQLGIHGIDLIRHLFGEIQSVKATIATTAKERKLTDGRTVTPDNEDLALGLYRLQSGLLAIHEVSYTEVAGTDRFRMEIYGDTGTAWLRTERGALAVNDGRGAWSMPELAPGDVRLRQHSHWLAMLRGEQPPDSSAQDGFVAVRVAEAIYRSAAKEGWEPVQV